MCSFPWHVWGVLRPCPKQTRDLQLPSAMHYYELQDQDRGVSYAEHVQCVSELGDMGWSWFVKYFNFYFFVFLEQTFSSVTCRFCLLQDPNAKHWGSAWVHRVWLWRHPWHSWRLVWAFPWLFLLWMLHQHLQETPQVHRCRYEESSAGERNQ